MIWLEKHKLFCDKRNLVNVRTAKKHEYETSLKKELYGITDIFHISENEWKEKKGILNKTIYVRLKLVGIFFDFTYMANELKEIIKFLLPEIRSNIR